jgi:hypothetical protein
MPMNENLNQLVTSLISGGVAAAMVTALVALFTLRANANKRTAETKKVLSETEKIEIEKDSALSDIYRGLIDELRDELERQKVVHHEELAQLRAALAAVKVEQERIKDHYQGQIEALEAKIHSLKLELGRERALRRKLQRKYEGIETNGDESNS